MLWAWQRCWRRRVPRRWDAGVVELVAGSSGQVRFAVLFGCGAVDQDAGGAEEPAGGAGEPPVVPVDQVVAGAGRCRGRRLARRPTGGEFFDCLLYTSPSPRD